MTARRALGESTTRRAPARAAQGRQHNLSLVLRVLHSGGPTSRASVARDTGLTRTTVSDLVSELTDLGYVIETGTEDQSRPGKPGTLVDINRRGRTVVAIDLTEQDALRAAVLDLDGTVLTRAARAITPGERVNPEDVLALTREAIASASAPVIGIGVGSPGIVTETGSVELATALGWEDVPLSEILREGTGLPVFVRNDADVAAQAHHALDNGSDDFVLIKLGPGVGAGLVISGRPVRGAHRAAGELGHVSVGTDGGPLCRCGRRGCLETWVAVPALTAATEGLDQSQADAALRIAGERLGIALGPIVAALDLTEVVIAGPEHLIPEVLLSSTQETLRDRVISSTSRDLVVRLAQDCSDIVLRGAAGLVLAEQLGIS